MGVSFFFTAWGANLSFLYKPLLEGDESSAREYFGDWNGRAAAAGAGVACGLGMAMQFMGGLGGGCAAALVMLMACMPQIVSSMHVSTGCSAGSAGVI